MERCTKESFEMTNDMETEHFDGKMEKFTKGLGLMENSMEKVLLLD